MSGGVGGDGVHELGRRSRLPAAVAVIAAVLALGAGLAYNYALHGGAKEVALIACLVTAAAVGRVALDSGLHPGTVGLLAVPLAAAVGIISAVAVAYAGALAIVLVGAAVLGEHRPSARAFGRAAAVGTAVFVVACLPFLKDTVSFGQSAGSIYGAGTDVGPAVYGHLLRPIPFYQLSASGPPTTIDIRSSRGCCSSSRGSGWSSPLC